MTTKRGLTATVTILFFLSLTLAGQSNKVTLKASQTKYNEESQTLVASGNVVFSYGEVELHSDKLYFNKSNQTVWSIGNITLKRGEDSFNPTYFYYDLINNHLVYNDINISVEAPDAKGPFFLKADSIEDDGDIKIGKNGIFTSCELDHPHYYIWAQKFKYEPEKRITAYNVFFYNPILFIPFGLWTPIYIYDIGERNTIWNFPAIGEKKTPGWGWFVQNTIDYNNINGKDSSIFVDWFENKGWGLGIQHQYRLGKQQPGTLYYYTLTEQDTGQTNLIRKVEQTFQPTDPLTLRLHYSDIDAERINSSGRVETISKGLNIDYDKIGPKTAASINESQNFRSNTKSLNANLSYKMNSEQRLNANYSRSDRYETNYSSQTAKLTHNKKLRSDALLTNQFNYLNTNTGNDTLPADQELEYYLTLKNELGGNFSYTLSIDHFFDLDQDNVTTDSDGVGNNFFFKQPEIKIDHTHEKFGVNFNETYTIARYQEVKFDSSTGKQRIYPEDNEFEAIPNTYIFNQSIKKSWKPSQLDTTFTMKTNYDQYVFKVPGNSLSDSDAMYTTTFELNQETTYFNFLEQTTSYKTTGSPDDNNSPFYKFDSLSTKRNHVTEGLRFYLFSPTKYYWNNEAGYNWVTQKWDDYDTTIGINPNSKFRWIIRTGSKINPIESQKESRFDPLTSQLSFSPTKNISIDHNISLDLNDYVYENLTTIHSSTTRFKFELGQDKDYLWLFNILFTYNTRNQDGIFDINRYEMQTIELVKLEHRRTLTLSYRKSNDEIRFKYKVNIYPSDTLGFKKNRDVWKIEGVLDDSNQERF